MGVRAATSPELTLFRTAGQFSRFWLAFYKPNTIYTARLASVPTSTDMVGQISFSSGVGTLADVKKEMTLWVGSTAGARDLGICRIRKAAIAGTFYIGLTSEINWQANCYLTVVDAFRIAARVPRMDAGALKMDYDISFSDQYTSFEPVPVLGTDAVAWLTGASVNVLFDAGDSWVFGSTISTFAWSAPGASASSGMATATPTITYNATGYYTVYCTVTSAAGKSYTGIRHVFVFGSAFMPQAVELTSSPSGSLDDGGWDYSLKMYASADPTNVIDGCLAVLFGEDWYGSTKQSIGQVANRENIICMGYVAGESIDWDPEVSEVEFSIEGAHSWMGEIEIAPIKQTIATNTPSSWDTMPAMTVDRALWHLLHWRSNVTALMDVRLTGDARYLPETDSEGSLWQQVSDIAWSKIFALPFVDRFGRLFVNVDPQLTPLASRTWATVMTIAKQDWKNQIQIKRVTRRPLSMLSISGWISDISGNVNTVYSLAMGHVHGRYGKPEILDKFLASSQTQFNTLAGLYVGWKNRELEFEIALGENNRMVDLFPPQYLAISLAAGDTPRGIAYSGKLIPRTVTLEYDPEAFCFETVLECEQETFAALAVDGDVPASSGVEDWDYSSFPDMDMPDMTGIEDITELPPSVDNPNHPKTVVIASTKGVHYTTYFDATSPTWQAMNNGLDATLFSASKQMIVTPNGAIWLLLRGALDYVYRASKVGAAFELMATSVSLDGGSINGIGYNPNAAEQVAVVAGTTDGFFGPSRLWVGSAGGFTAGGATWGSRPATGCAIVYKSNNWYVFYAAAIPFSTSYAVKLTATGGIVTSANIHTATGQDNTAKFAVARASDIFQWDNAASAGFNIITSALVPTRYTTIDITTNHQGVAFSPDKTIAMGAVRTTLTPYLSTDGGASWSSVAGVLSTGSDIWENCKDNNRWIFGGGSTLRLTVDRGTSYVDKAGNLGYIAALLDIEAIRFIA